MDAIRWSMVGGILTFMVTFGTLVFRLAARMVKSEEKSESAHLKASAIGVHLDQVERELVEHRVAVAKEYVSQQALASIEIKLIEAINRIGDRLDKLLDHK
jgi:hypothetical protein